MTGNVGSRSCLGEQACKGLTGESFLVVYHDFVAYNMPLHNILNLIINLSSIALYGIFLLANVSINSCENDFSCFQAMGTIGESSCKGATSCQDTQSESIILDEACRGFGSCRGNKATINSGSCVGRLSCMNNEALIGEGSVRICHRSGLLWGMS